MNGSAWIRNNVASRACTYRLVVQFHGGNVRTETHKIRGPHGCQRFRYACKRASVSRVRVVLPSNLFHVASMAAETCCLNRSNRRPDRRPRDGEAKVGD